MYCQHCNKKLSIIQRLKGLTFCSAEHQELHFGLSFERLRESVTEFTPRKLPPLWPDAKQKSSPADPEQSQASPAQPQTKSETPQAEPMVAEPQAGKAVPAPLPTLEIANLVEAIGTASGVDLPEAPFLPELPSSQDQAASPLKSYAAEPVFAMVQLPVSATQKAPLQPSPSRSRVQKVSPAQLPAEVAPIATQVTWPAVPQGYPPVIVSASATLLLDSNGAQLMSLPMGEACRGEVPVLPLQTDAIETPLRQPRLPTRPADRRPVSRVPAISARPPQAPIFDSFWKGRPGSGPVPPPLAGILRPQRDVTRLAPPVAHGIVGALPTFPLIAASPGSPVPPKDLPAVPASHLEASVTPRRIVSNAKASLTSPALTLPSARSPLAIGSSAPLRGEASLAELPCDWLPIIVASHLPHVATGLSSGPSGLSLSADAIPVRCSSATNYPPAFATAPADTRPIPFLLLSMPWSMAAPAMPFSSGVRTLRREACRLPVQISEKQFMQGAAHLQPSLPSPMSLVTWSRSLAISIPAPNPSILGSPAPIRLSANPGTGALRPKYPTRRMYRPTPLLPQPAGMMWEPVAPMQASLRPTVLKPIVPGSQGTAPPRLTTVRVQPASMPVLPPSSAPFRIQPVDGLAFAGPSPEARLKVASVDMAHGTSIRARELRVVSTAALPLFADRRRAPAIGLASWSSPSVWWIPMPTSQPVNTVPPFSDLKRLAWSLTAGLPGAATTQPGPRSLSI